MQSGMTSVQLCFPYAQNSNQTVSKFGKTNSGLWRRTSVVTVPICPCKNGAKSVKRFRLIIAGSTKKKKLNLLEDSENGGNIMTSKRDGIYGTMSKHGMHMSGMKTQNLYRVERKIENESTRSKEKPLGLRRQRINYDISHKDIRRIENTHGGWGKIVPYTPESKAKPLNSSKGEDFKFDFAGDFFSSRTFRDIGASKDMLQALNTQGILRPSHVQAMAYKDVLDGQSCIIAEQSGSGKTLAYLSPLVQRLKDEECEGKSKSFSKSPRALILVPTAELATQVLNACRSISKAGVPFRSMVATGGFKWKTQLENLENGIDILIATPGRFCSLVQEGKLQLGNILSTVLDEVDILFDDDEFSLALEKLTNSAPLVAQYLFVTATLPLDVHNKILEKFPDCKAIFGPRLHRTCSGLEEILIDCSGEGEERNPETAFENKKTALLQLLEQSPVQKTLIFCNKIETCRKVENVLKRYDRKGRKVSVLPFHAAVSQESRVSNMKRFLDSQSEQSRFLICTDRASRGLDLVNVDHVVLFDFPRDPSEYVRRVGRTARAGRRGKAFAFAVGKQVSLAQRIMDRNEKGHPLHDLPSIL
uniref:TSA: Wollemia nobilis Ref_Wollemi_Transcript_28233_2443 transcribed RNA sequence n=1 Tax=Wollemia nobilis TaxID=56998 RepID=A0A0C9RPX7_9CONI